MASEVRIRSFRNVRSEDFIQLLCTQRFLKKRIKGHLNIVGNVTRRRLLELGAYRSSKRK
jgi:hypothetical protein